MICAGEGAGVIANIRNGSLDKSNICTTPAECGAAPTNGKEKKLGKMRPYRAVKHK